MLPTVTEVAVFDCVVTRGFAAFIKLAGALSSRLFCSYGRGMLFSQHTAIITNLVTGVTPFFNLTNEKRIPKFYTFKTRTQTHDTQPVHTVVLEDVNSHSSGKPADEPYPGQSNPVHIYTIHSCEIR
jgi:hypothetical protein